MSRTTPRLLAIPAALLLALALAGCAPQDDGYAPAVAERLQAEVLEVSQASAASDFAAALVSLDELGVELADALARGSISQERYDSITAAMALVRADLQAAIEAQAPPDEPVTDDGDNSGGDSGPGNSDKGNNGKGKGKDGKGNDGKGKGRDKGKD